MSRNPSLSHDASRPAALYPPIEPYASGHLDVGAGHRVYWEACGNPLGKPALFLHSGPGGGCNPNHRRLFDPDRYRIVLFDQRGCGRSLPHAGIANNTTAHLVSDIQALRRMLRIERWLLFGGSWGATLALAYAQAHPERASGLVLRGIFTARRCELDWLYRSGASFLFPDAWRRFIEPIWEDERGDLACAYLARLTSGNAAIEREAAKAWCAWEDALMTLRPSPPANAPGGNLLALARIEAHYVVHGAFLEEGELLSSAHRLRDIPGMIVQGRYDAVTPPATAWDLHRAWPQAEIEIVPDAGHASSEPGILRRLIATTDAFACAG